MKEGEDQRAGFIWILQALCHLFSKPFSTELAMQQIMPPFSREALRTIAKTYGFTLHKATITATQLHKSVFPLLVWVRRGVRPDAIVAPAFILQADTKRVLLLLAGSTKAETVSQQDFFMRYTGQCERVEVVADDVRDPDAMLSGINRKIFGFSWFIPELLAHRKIWKEILLASLVIQLIALAMPLFTQAIIDKVIVHRTQSTLIVLVIGMIVFTLFSALLSWVRQYLILHTGNRVDAALGGAVFDHLLKLPPVYFSQRPTGVIAARLHGVETIREFIASAAVTLLLDLPFLLLFVAIMFYYSVMLTLVVMAILALIVLVSFAISAIFKDYLQQQFLLDARNQAFLTEYIAGMETVKSLQLEPQLSAKYSMYLASYLRAGFDVKQLANTYNAIANFLEQMMGMLILGIGAYTVMHSPEFTIGMLIAFQMYSGKISQPLLRLVGLWQQFQQAALAVERLGDLMNVPKEPYSLTSANHGEMGADIRIEALAFRYNNQQPFLYEDLWINIGSGKTVAIMGASGCGKSTLTKLLLGFYQPERGRITIGSNDIRHMTANELRNHFGVVPQETILFSGTIFDNLLMANPAMHHDQIVQACRMAEIHDVIAALPKGYQTEIGERGAGLSGGQKQRIAIARALLQEPRILIFDEATSSLDKERAAALVRTINHLKGHVTIVFITHALPENLHIDDVFVLENGNVRHEIKAAITPPSPEPPPGEDA